MNHYTYAGMLIEKKKRQGKSLLKLYKLRFVCALGFAKCLGKSPTGWTFIDSTDGANISTLETVQAGEKVSRKAFLI